MITVDWDNKLYDLNPRLVYWRLRRKTGCKVKVKHSSSGRGYHFIVDYSGEDADEIRKELDDCWRVYYEKKHPYRPSQVLWSEKVVDGFRFPSTEMKSLLGFKLVNLWSGVGD